MRLKLFGAVLLVMAAGLGSFFAVRALRPESPPAIAQPAPTPVPSPPVQGPPPTPAVDPGAAADRALTADRAKPRFDGIVNGIRVFTEDPSIPFRESAFKLLCVVDRDFTPSPEMIRTSGLDFTVPAYLGPYYELASACGDTIVIFSRTFKEDHGVRYIERLRSNHVWPAAQAPADRIKPVTVNGKPAVLISAIVVPETGQILFEHQLIIAEDFGLTVIYGQGDVLSIAQDIFK